LQHLLINGVSVTWTAVCLLYNIVQVLKYYSYPHFQTKIYTDNPKSSRKL